MTGDCSYFIEREFRKDCPHYKHCAAGNPKYHMFDCVGCEQYDDTKKLFTKLDDLMNDIKSDMKNVGGNSDKPKHERLKIIPMILETIDRKNDEYSVDPISVLSIDDLITQMHIKIIRARYAKSPEKRLDEFIDIIVYGILTGEKQVEVVDNLKKELSKSSANECGRTII